LDKINFIEILFKNIDIDIWSYCNELNNINDEYDYKLKYVWKPTTIEKLGIEIFNKYITEYSDELDKRGIKRFKNDE